VEPEIGGRQIEPDDEACCQMGVTVVLRPVLKPGHCPTKEL
jgi:hypothetical protein